MRGNSLVVRGKPRALAPLLVRLVALVVVLYVADATTSNALHLPGETAVSARAIVPEGWAFFTRDAEEPDVYVYVRRRGQWKAVTPTPNSASGNLFGASRTARAVHGNLMGITRHTDRPFAWRTCDKATSTESCLVEFMEAGPPVSVRFTSTAWQPCGLVALVLQPPVPWAWASTRRYEMTRTAAVFDVECDATQAVGE